ncbi:hypothetical protein ABFX02_02G179900 [Erythranthe guttata]
MKIFNWVHRRFVHKDGLGENGKKIEGDDEGNFVVDDHENKNGTFCGWKGGILTIGTFGYDPIILEDDRDQNHELDDDDVIAASFIYAPKDDEPRRRLAEKELEQQQLGNDRRQMITENNNYKLDVVITHDSEEEEQPLLYAVYDHHDYCDEGLLEMKMEESQPHDLHTNKKERTTLADLFSADSELDNIINININELKKKRLQAATIVNNMKEADDHVIDKMMSNIDLPFANYKLDKARPIHKLHRLMRRMMKRKIHPAEINGGGLTNYSKLAADFTESASLLSS